MMAIQHGRCIFVSLILSAVVFVVWSLAYARKFQLQTAKTCSDSDLQWKPSNPAMSACIGYGNNSKIIDNTSCKRRLSNTIIIGVWKCGTHALLTFLSKHPQIVRNTDIYEYNFFKSHYANGLEWYRDRLPCSLPGQIVIDNSAPYFTSAEAPRRIFDFNPTITKTCPCNVYPPEPHFYIAKLGFAGVYLFFLFLLQNIDCGYSLEPNVYPQSMF